MKIFKTQLALLIMWIVFLCGIITVADAIDYLPGSGVQSLPQPTTRDTDYGYHTSTDDYHWYGTDKWAVRFDFSAAYPTYTNTRFVIHDVLVYVPVAGGNIRVELKSDANGIIIENPSLADTTVASNLSGWRSIAFSSPDTVRVGWIVVTMPTTSAGPYVSASRGGGTHSYFWNTNTPSTPYYQSFFNAGFNCELLIGVRGRFLLSDIDAELASFDLGPNMVYNGRVSPMLTIYNHSDVPLNQARVEINLRSPNPFFNLNDIIQITSPIAAHSELTITHGDPSYPGHTYQLPDYPTQIMATAKLRSEYDPNPADTLHVPADSLFNNTITRIYNCFNRDFACHLTENFLRLSTAENFYAVQDTVSEIQNLQVLNYFPLASDSLYAPGAYQRFNWYNFMGLPMTVVNGNGLIPGFSQDTYHSLYRTHLLTAALDKTFLRESECRADTINGGASLRVRLGLSNEETYMFSPHADSSLVKQSRFFAALVRRVHLADEDRYVFDRWGAFADTVMNAIPIGTNWQKEFVISLQDISLDYLESDYKVIYWLQHNANRQIIYANTISLDGVGVDDDMHPSPVPFGFSLYPNPVQWGHSFSLKLPSAVRQKTDCTIYNLKGQRITSYTLPAGQGSLRIDSSIIPTSGIYFVRLSSQSQSSTRKLLILK